MIAPGRVNHPDELPAAVQARGVRPLLARMLLNHACIRSESEFGLIAEGFVDMDLLTDIPEALAALSDRALLGLRAGVAGVPDAVPGLITWIEHVVDWEIARRGGRYYELQGPRAGILDAEINMSLVTLATLAERFRDSGETDAADVAAFLEVAGAILRAEVEQPSRLQ